MYKAYFAPNLEGAKKLNPEIGSFVVITGIALKMGEEWKKSEGGSLPESFLPLQSQNVILVKITEKKTKFYKYPEKKSVCYAEPYYQAIQRLE